jgi:hypothetical protein
VKIIVWSSFLVLALLWTAGAALVAQLTEWSLGILASGTATDLVEAVAQAPIPAWLAPWLNLAGWRELLQGFTALLQSITALLPTADQSLGWLVPFIWIIWGIGMVALLLLTFIGSRLIRA